MMENCKKTNQKYCFNEKKSPKKHSR